jgi:hypothetical protein
MYSFKSSFHCSASCWGTTPRTTATPFFFNSELNFSGALSMFLKSISGIAFDPDSMISGTSSRRSRSSLSQDSRTAFSWPRIKRPLRPAYSGPSGARLWPDSEKKASDISPARFCVCVDAARSCGRILFVPVVRRVENMVIGCQLMLQWSAWRFNDISKILFLFHYIYRLLSLLAALDGALPDRKAQDVARARMSRCREVPKQKGLLAEFTPHCGKPKATAPTPRFVATVRNDSDVFSHPAPTFDQRSNKDSANAPKDAIAGRTSGEELLDAAMATPPSHAIPFICPSSWSRSRGIMAG